MIALLVIIVLLLASLAVSLFLLGFKIGGSSWQSELMRVRTEGALASRQLSELHRQAFIALAEEAERRHRS